MPSGVYQRPKFIKPPKKKFCLICPKEIVLKKTYCCRDHCKLAYDSYVGETLAEYKERKKNYRIKLKEKIKDL